MSAVIESTNLTLRIAGITCGVCGVAFGLEQSYLSRVRAEGTWFHCPNGHKVHYGESEIDRLKKEVERGKGDTKWYRERADGLKKTLVHTERRLSATRGVVTRHKRRIQAGQCVCCSKKFKDLEQHMATRHPDWSPEKHADALEVKS